MQTPAATTPWLQEDQRWKQPSYSSIQRSVSGMKNLLPLRLLSPSLPEVEFWPTVGPKYKSFGQRRHSRGIPPPLDVHKKFRGVPLNRFRDTPIYTEPGSALCQAYFTNEDLSRPVRTSKRQDHPTLEQRPIKKTFVGSMDTSEYGYFQGHMSRAQDIDKYLRESRCLSRSSALSFQCTGEPTYNHSPLWTTESQIPSSCVTESVIQDDLWDDNVQPSRVESWFSDTSEYESDEGVLSCATALAPAKAHVVNVNRLSTSTQSIPIPPRSSSIRNSNRSPNHFTNERDSWTSQIYSPPSVYSQRWTCDDGDDHTFGHPSLPIPIQFHRQPMNHDLAMTSPPLTPLDVFPQPPNTRYSSLLRPISISRPHSTKSQHLEIPSDVLPLLSSLEQNTTSFPSTMLLLSSPCINQIRRNLFPYHNQHQTEPSPKPSKIPILSREKSPYYNPPSQSPPTPLSIPKQCPLQRRRTMKLPSRPYPTPHVPRVSRSFPDIRQQSLPKLPEPNLTPLLRIFPNTSRTMRSALHAHILAYLFVTSLLSSFPSQQSPQPPSHSSKQNNKKISIHEEREMEIINSYSDVEYLERLAEEVKQCVFKLVAVMDESVCLSTDGVGELVLRCLGEVVRGAETCD